MNQRLFLLGLLVLAACGRGSPAPAGISQHVKTAPVDRDFILAVGESAHLANTPLTIGFVRVEEDSRCPPGVTCVWAGNGRVGLRVTGEGPDEHLALNTTVNPQSMSVHGFMLRLIALSQRPAGQPDSTGYKATLILSREAP